VTTKTQKIVVQVFGREYSFTPAEAALLRRIHRETFIVGNFFGLSALASQGLVKRTELIWKERVDITGLGRDVVQALQGLEEVREVFEFRAPLSSSKGRSAKGGLRIGGSVTPAFLTSSRILISSSSSRNTSRRRLRGSASSSSGVQDGKTSRS
jgi:hypothetical protein